MNRAYLSFVLGLCVVLTLPIVSYAQGARRPRPAAPSPAAAPSTETAQRRVTVTLKGGDVVSGNFLRADADTVQIQVAGNPVGIKWDDVVSIKTPLASATEPATSNSTSDERGTLNLEAGIVFRSGDTKPVARVEFHLLDMSVSEILKAGGYQLSETYRGAVQRGVIPEERATLSDFAGGAKYQQQTYLAGMAAIRPHIIHSVRTDFSGKAQLTGITPGRYYLFSIHETPRGFAVWNLPVEVKAGQNSVALDQNNAAVAF